MGDKTHNFTLEQLEFGETGLIWARKTPLK
jgi:hypothetical protein